MCVTFLMIYLFEPTFAKTISLLLRTLLSKLGKRWKYSWHANKNKDYFLILDFGKKFYKSYD